MTRKSYIVGIIAFVLGGLLTYLMFQGNSTSGENNTSSSSQEESEKSTQYT